MKNILLKSTSRNHDSPPSGRPAIGMPATTIYSNSFETATADCDTFGGVFSAIRVASGTHGIASASGDFHAENSRCGSAFRWGGYNFGAGNAVPTPFQEYSTSVAIYLDVCGGWANHTRFDFDSAINNAAGSYLRDFFFNAGFYHDSDGSPGSGTSRFVISASTKSQPGHADPKNPGETPIAIPTTGWYTFVHHFYDHAGLLVVDMSILEASGALVKTWTIRTADRTAGVGGNGYGWFNFNQFSTLAFDDVQLSTRTARLPLRAGGIGPTQPGTDASAAGSYHGMAIF